jgi:hypothetical protein
MRAICFGVDTLFVSDISKTQDIHNVNIVHVRQSKIQEYPGPLGRNTDVIPSILKHLNTNSYIDTYLSLLLRKTDPKSSLFLLTTSKVDTTNNLAARLLVLLCQKDLLAAVNLAREAPRFWAVVFAFISALHAETRVINYANSVFAKSHSLADGSMSQVCTKDEETFIKCILKFVQVSAEEGDSEVFTQSDPSADREDWELYASLFATYAQKKFATKFLVSLGRNLVALKNVEAGHICFLLAGELPGAVDDPNSLLCILGADHHDAEKLSRLVEPDQIARTEVLEFATRLNQPDVECFRGLQPFKLVLAKRFAEIGDEARAMKYVTFIHAFVRALPATQFSFEFKTQLKEFEKLLQVRARSPKAPNHNR